MFYDVGKYLIAGLGFYWLVNLFPKNTKIGETLFYHIQLNLIQLLGLLAVNSAITMITYHLSNREKFRLLENDLYTDSLTGLPNDKAFKKEFKGIVDSAKHRNQALSLIFMDVDNLKLINDDPELGPKVADQMLKRLGRYLKEGMRDTDSIFRQHNRGDEFLILARNTNLEGAMIAAERKRENISGLELDIPGVNNPLKLTVSCGVVSLDLEDDTEDSFLARGHKAVLNAKSKPGKNNSSRLI